MLISTVTKLSTRLLKGLRSPLLPRMSATVVADVPPVLPTSPNPVGDTVKETDVKAPEKRPLEDPVSEVEEKKPRNEAYVRIKRRKYAVLISYSGQGYLGLQRNPGMKTIEEDLLSAWHKVGIIDDAAFANARNVDFQRAARTDKGVSAVRQILSAKLPMEVDIEAVNQHLPDQIRMVALKRATKGFNCKGNADARTYSYTMPSFALAPKEEPISEDYRISKEVLERTNQVLGIYVGTHNYHNFTSKKSFSDPSANRYMMQLYCDEPIMCEGVEYVTIYVKGQSFMLHQIRKMVGLAIAVVRGLAPESAISKAWQEEKLDIPIAPGLGLVLEEVHYDRYNQRFGSDGMHEAIEWSSVKSVLDEFKRKYILSSIITTEKEEKSMIAWLETLSMHTFDIRNVHRQSAPSAEDETISETAEKNGASLEGEKEEETLEKPKDAAGS